MHFRAQRRARPWCAWFPLVLFLCAVRVVPAAGEEPDQLRRQAFAQAYNLDHAEARRTLDRALALDDRSAAAHRSVASLTWLNILFRRGTVTVEDYLGQISRPNVAVEKPPAELAERFRLHAERAIAVAEARLRSHPRDADAHYELGTAVGLLASYTASVEGRVLGAFRTARRAYQAHETVLSIDPARKDAGLIVGLYRYLVAGRSLPVRWMAYLAGFGGGRERGLAMIEEAAAFAGESQTEARFALILLYNRDKRYDDALEVIGLLQSQFPRNRLLWLEEGATALRAGHHQRADAALTRGIEGLRADPRERAFGEEALWHYQRGAARLALGRLDAARRDLETGMAAEAHEWVHGRLHLEFGKLAERQGRRAQARAAYEQAVRLCEAGNDGRGAAEARRRRDASREEPRGRSETSGTPTHEDQTD